MLSTPAAASLAPRIAAQLRARNDVMRAFFEAEAPRLARASQEVAERFARGGRLYAFGNGPYATDAAHVSVEFIHPVIVGKRALPAMDASAAPEAFVEALVGPDDMAIAFGPPEGDLRTIAALRHARRRGAYTLAWPGIEADYSVTSPTADEHVHQEAFEVLGHTLYESVHVFLEHRRELGDDVGASAFLYPYLGSAQPDAGAIVDGVAASIVEKARDGERLREADRRRAVRRDRGRRRRDRRPDRARRPAADLRQRRLRDGRDRLRAGLRARRAGDARRCPRSRWPRSPPCCPRSRTTSAPS